MYVKTMMALLTSVVERTAIEYNSNHEISFIDEDGKEQILDPKTPVSMNMWGFTPDYFEFGEREFKNSSIKISRHLRLK